MEKIKHAIKSSKLLTKTYRFVFRLVLTLYWNLQFLLNKLFRKNEAYGCCFVFTTMFGRLKKNNWGDDLNEYLFGMMTDKKIRFVQFDQLLFCPKVTRYSLIGSIIGDFNLDNTVIYGSGAITSDPLLQGRPRKVLSVRGPLTREALLKKGIDCPPVYGDPALLLPLVYRPDIKNGDCIGVIPHYRTADSDLLSAWKKDDRVRMIDMSKYEKWTDIIDAVLQCKVIISESLHGLIVAESYGIPCVWIEVAPHDCPWEWEFKFFDFYRSIGKDDPKCYKLYEGYSLTDLLEKAKEWTPGTIDYDAMLKAFPFALKDNLKK